MAVVLPTLGTNADSGINHLKVSPAYSCGMPGAESGPVIVMIHTSSGSNLIRLQPSGGCTSQSLSSLCSNNHEKLMSVSLQV